MNKLSYPDAGLARTMHYQRQHSAFVTLNPASELAFLSTRQRRVRTLMQATRC